MCASGDGLGKSGVEIAGRGGTFTVVAADGTLACGCVVSGREGRLARTRYLRVSSTQRGSGRHDGL